MQFKSMQFDDKDIEAVAASRVNRTESKKTMQWLIGVVVVILAGAVLMTETKYKGLGFGVLAVGFAIYLYWQNQISTKQKRAKSALLQAWHSQNQVRQ